MGPNPLGLRSPRERGNLDINTHMGVKWPGRDWSDTSTSQRRLRNVGEREEARKGPSHGFRGSMAS